MKSAKHVVVVEVCTLADRAEWTDLSAITLLYVRVQASRRLAQGHRPPFLPGALVSLADAPPLLAEAICSLRLCDVSFPLDCAWSSMEEVDFHMRLYRLCAEEEPCGGGWRGNAASLDTGAAPCTLPLAGDNDGGDVPAFTITPLPHASLEGLWESLYYGESEAASIAFKRDIVSYVDAAMRFTRAGVSPHLISWNRLVLFYGPPGTGKTSLCRALAQKLAIRLTSSGFSRACVLDINAHSLFSRWFSESGKQVLHLFDQIHRIAADTDCLVCCVMDEVESLAAARTSAMKGNEPSDSIRVVNALLTQVDRLQRCANILVLSTSNLTDAIDEALLDRADKRIYVGPPGLHARQVMLQSSVQELLEKGLVGLPLTDEEGSARICVDVELRSSGGTGGTAEAEEGGAVPHALRGKDYPSCDDCDAESPALQNEEAQATAPAAQKGTSWAVPDCSATASSVSSSAAPVGMARPAALGSDGATSPAPRPRYTLTALLRHVAEASEGLNGRTLKKLPFLAYGTCVCNGAVRVGAAVDAPMSVDLAAFLEALFDAARQAAADGSAKQKA